MSNLPEKPEDYLDDIRDDMPTFEQLKQMIELLEKMIKWQYEVSELLKKIEENTGSMV